MSQIEFSLQLAEHPVFVPQELGKVGVLQDGLAIWLKSIQS